MIYPQNQYDVESVAPHLSVFYFKLSAIRIILTSPCNVYPLTTHFYIVKMGFTGVYVFFLFLL